MDFMYFMVNENLPSRARRSEDTISEQDVANQMGRYAALNAKKGEWREALLAWKRALRIYKACLGEEHPKVATVLNKIGVAYYCIGEPFYAYDSFDKALEIQEKVLLPGDKQICVTLQNISLVHSEVLRESNSELSD